MTVDDPVTAEDSPAEVTPEDVADASSVAEPAAPAAGQDADAATEPEPAEPQREPQPEPAPQPAIEPESRIEPVPEPQIEPEIELTGPPSARLAQLGLELPPVVEPLGAYVPAVRTGDLIFTSGQLPLVSGSLQLTGVVGDQPVDISVGQAKDLARLAALNAVAAIGQLVDIDTVGRVVKVVGFVASAPGFTQQPQVINGASELLGQLWGEAGRHARSAVGVTALPLNSPVEVEVVVEVGAATPTALDRSRDAASDTAPDPVAHPE